MALKEIFDVEDQLFEQEIAMMWGISSHPNVITFVGYSENPRCIITKVFSFIFFSFFFLFFDQNYNSYTKQICGNLFKIILEIFQVI